MPTDKPARAEILVVPDCPNLQVDPAVYLSGVLLTGLMVNSMFGWAWAVSIAALVIGAMAVNEGR